MNRLLHALMGALTLILFAGTSHGQGTIIFNNINDKIYTNGPSGPGLIQSGQFAFGLYMASTTNALLSSTTPALVITNHGFAGIISGSYYALNGFLITNTYVFQIKAWTANGAQSLEEAFASAGPDFKFGVSAIGQATLGGDTVPPAVLFGTQAGQVTSFVAGMVAPMIIAAPEPSTWALALSSLCILGVSRWRRAR